QLGALAFDVAIEFQDPVQSLAAPDQGIDLQPIAFELLQHTALGLGGQFGNLTPGVCEEVQRPAGGDGGIKLAHRAGGAIARIGVGRLAVLFLPLVQGLEGLVGHIDLAAYFQHGRRLALQPERNVRDGAQIGGNVLAFHAVAAGGALHQHAMLIAQGGRQAVDLGLGRHRDLFGFLQAQETAHPAQKLRHILVTEGIVQGQHRHAMAHLGEFFGCLGADAMTWAVGTDQKREARLDLGIAPAQGIIVRIGNIGCVLAMISAIGLGDLFRQAVEFFLGLGRDQFVDGFHARLRCFLVGVAASAISRLAAARASLVTLAPDSMRAISSSRASSSSNSIFVLSLAREMRKCRAARAATCGECVTSSTCVVSARRCRRSPTASATAPPTPRSTSSNTMAAGEETWASATFSAREKRASSPPEAILAKPPKAAPSTVATSKAIFSRPAAVPLSSSSFSSATRNLACPSFRGASSAATAASSFRAAPARALDSLRAAVR